MVDRKRAVVSFAKLTEILWEGTLYYCSFSENTVKAFTKPINIGDGYIYLNGNLEKIKTILAE